MKRPLRLLSVLLAVGAVATLVLGAAGFTTVEANRTVDVAVVDDDEAYIGIKDSVDSCGTVDLVENRFATTLDTVEIEVQVPSEETQDIKINGELLSPSGDKEIAETDISPGDAAEVQIERKVVNNSTVSPPGEISVEVSSARGGGIEASVDERRVELNC